MPATSSASACALVAEACAAAGFIVLASALQPAPDAPSLATAAALGAALAASVWVARPASGGHVNPASTAALVVAQALTPAAAGWIVAGQAVGALLGGCALAALLPSAHLFRAAGAPGCVASLPAGAAAAASLFAWEALGAAAVTTALTTTARGAAAALAPVTVGTTFAAYVAAAGAAGRAVLLNPLRALVPPILYGGCGGKPALLYLGADIVGILIAAAVAPLLAPLTAPETEQVGGRPAAVAAAAAEGGGVQDPLLATPVPATPGYGV